MGDKTGIEWTDATWNPTRGCARVSPGCENCYAERFAARLSFHGGPYAGLAEHTDLGPRWTRRLRVVEDAMTLPLRWKRPRRVFVDSMSDLFAFGPEVVARVFSVMQQCPQHTFQVLTKRSGEMRARVPQSQFLLLTLSPLGSHGIWPLPNVHLGVSVENQEYADVRVPDLLATPAAVRFVSYEPALGEVDPMIFEGVDWVIVGGESGPGARPFYLAWARRMVSHFRGTRTRVFVKQMGSNAFDPSRGLGEVFPRVKYKHRSGGDPAEWPEELRVREYPA